MEDRCEVCHAEPYAPLRDGACLDCHAGVGAHAASPVLLDAEQRDACGACHREHRGAAGATTYSDEACTTCHASLSAHDSRTLLKDVASWSEHPHFRPSVVVEARLSRRERVPMTSEGLEGGAVERSGLIFPHREHVFPGPLGKVMLACETCHTADAAGAGMRPIRFAEHCQSCHPLLFDERHPQHQAPHVAPARVAESLDVFYAWLALNGLARDPEAPPPARRRPAKEMTETERAGALQWARDSAQRAGWRLLAGSCTTCHFVERDAQPAAARLDAVSASGDSAQADDAAAQAAGPAAATGTPHATLAVEGHAVIVPVRVVPLEQSDAWLPLASFSHVAHGDVDCEHCHDVRYVRNAEAVLLPAIDTCRQCHAAEASAGKVGSPCVSCHGFHREHLGTIGDGVHASAAGAIDATVAQ